jgi:hypothetical protein
MGSESIEIRSLLSERAMIALHCQLALARLPAAALSVTSPVFGHSR